MNLPRDNLKATLWWPLALMFCTIGVVYGVMGLRRDQRRRAAVCGLVLNSILSIPAIPKTWEAVRDVLDAYKYSKGVIVSADR